MKENYDTKPHFSPYYNTIGHILSNWSFITHMCMCVFSCVYILYMCVWYSWLYGHVYINTRVAYNTLYNTSTSTRYVKSIRCPELRVMIRDTDGGRAVWSSFWMKRRCSRPCSRRALSATSPMFSTVSEGVRVMDHVNCQEIFTSKHVA